MHDERSILPVSSAVPDNFDVYSTNNNETNTVAYSMPAIVGRNGIERLVPITLSEAERKALNASIEQLKTIICETSG